MKRGPSRLIKPIQWRSLYRWTERMNLLKTSSQKLRVSLCALLGLMFGLTTCSAHRVQGQGSIRQIMERKLVRLNNGCCQLVLRLNYNGHCVLDQVIVRGHEVAGDSGVFTGICVGGRWFTTKILSRRLSLPGKTPSL